MDDITKKLIEDLAEKAERPQPSVPNPHVDRLFQSWGGKPKAVDNWQAIALSALEVAIWALSGAPRKERDEQGHS